MTHDRAGEDTFPLKRASA